MLMELRYHLFKLWSDRTSGDGCTRTSDVIVTEEISDIMVDVAGRVKVESELRQNLHIINSLSGRLLLDIYPSSGEAH